MGGKKTFIVTEKEMAYKYFKTSSAPTVPLIDDCGKFL